MFVPPDENEAFSEEDTLLALRDYFHELQTAQIQFEELWFATGQGLRLPDKEMLSALLRQIAGRAELIEVTFTTLRILRTTRAH